MTNIKILKQKEIETGWEFNTSIDDLDFAVTVDKKYWLKLTEGKEDPSELIRRSFEFLLAQEPKESILRHFNLCQIQTYFPEYENHIKTYQQT